MKCKVGNFGQKDKIPATRWRSSVNRDVIELEELDDMYVLNGNWIIFQLKLQ